MVARLKQRPDILARGREIVEYAFGTIKQWMNQGAFVVRGLENVRAEFSLTTLVHNLRRAHHFRHKRADCGRGGMNTASNSCPYRKLYPPAWRKLVRLDLSPGYRLANSAASRQLVRS